MRYFGGKQRIASQIASVMPCGMEYSEPFVGGGSVLAAVQQQRKRYASDANKALITMWTALQLGWEPPKSVSECEYQKAKGLPDDDPRKAFIGFGCSFSGKWFGGYARGPAGRNYALNAYNSVVKRAERHIGVTFEHADYTRAWYPESGVVYLDPPYANTTQYGAVGDFNTADFWRFARDLSTDLRLVYVSEYKAPEGWRPVWSKSVTTDIRGRSGRLLRQERLWVFG